MRNLIFYLKVINWHWRHGKLMIRAIIKWGIFPDYTIKDSNKRHWDLENRVKQTIYGYELSKLDEEYEKLTGIKRS